MQGTTNSQISTEQPWSPPSTFDGYRKLSVLGKGGMGEVFLCHDAVLDRPVAVKFISGMEPNSKVREQFLTEARAAARLQHPNVVVVYRVGEIDGHPYIVSEYIRGENLAHLPKPIPWQEVIELGLGLSRGLAAAHRRGILHRDIKPSNAILSLDGDIKLVDFGLAKVIAQGPSISQEELPKVLHPGDGDDSESEPTEDVIPGTPTKRFERKSAQPAESEQPTIREMDRLDPTVGSSRRNLASRLGLPPPSLSEFKRSLAQSNEELQTGDSSGIRGTPRYMAPEVLCGTPASRRSDVYSLGALLYELCVGLAPHSRVPAADLATVVSQVDAVPLRTHVPDVDERFATMIDRCLRRDPSERFASAEDMLEILEQLSWKGSAAVIPDGNPYRGLLPFEAEHRSLFFGRQEEIGTLLDWIRSDSFVLIVADSGAGKSSLCRAGVLPMVADGGLGGSRSWTSASMVPGRQPLHTLAATLAQSLQHPDFSEERIAERIRKDPPGFGRTLQNHLGAQQGLILFVDQLEELVSISDAKQAAMVAETLASLVQRLPGTRLLATVRSDFLARCATLPGLGGELTRPLFFLKPLNEAGVREAIVGPARLKGVSFQEEETVNHLVQFTLRTDGSLPLLQFALAELWTVRKEAEITPRALDSIGGVEGALARHGDGLISSLPSGPRKAARRMLMSLVTLEGTRTRRSLDELVHDDPSAPPALETLVKGRLLVVRESPEGALYEVAHEALIKGWHTLTRWLEEAAESRAVKHRLEMATNDWIRLNQSRDGLWNLLQVAEAEILEPQEIAPRERKFLDASRRQGLRNRRIRRIIAVTVPLIVMAVVAGIRLNTIERDRQARKQAELTKKMGQEMSLMEWLLRSARQLAPHDLDREKDIIRKRMSQLQTELASYGELSRGLAYYALGRGHMALHEYPQALSALQQAIAHGNQSAEVHYALGFVLGKHYEQAMHDARLAGGGDWARKQLKEIEPKYLQPAIESLVRSRAMQHDNSEYLEGTIAFYQRKYDAALEHADAALRESPWLYDADKLAGDIHLEQALQAKDSGRYEEAEREFASAVKRYEAAAATGRSDGEVYVGLAEAWIRQIEMAIERGRPTEAAYATAVVAADKIALVDPQNIEGPLKKAFAAERTMRDTHTGQDSASRAQDCVALAEQVLKKQPEHPYASEMAANCSVMLADAIRSRGQDPEPYMRKALRLLEPIVQKYPHFLWGLNDLAMAQIALGIQLQLHGSPAAKEMFQKSMESASAAATLDSAYMVARENFLWTMTYLPIEARSVEEVGGLLLLADEWLAKCKAINSQSMQCFNNYFQVYARAADRLLLAGQDPGPLLQAAQTNLAEARRLGGNNVLDAEQLAALTHRVDAANRVRQRQDPAPALAELQKDLASCFKIAPTDAMCRTLAAQTDWVQAEWMASQGKPNAAILEAAQVKATRATQSLETYPDAWATLAESHLRLARQKGLPMAQRREQLFAGLAALEKLFVINPNHAQGLALRGALLLMQAEGEADGEKRSASKEDALKSLKRALALDPLLTHGYAPLLHAAGEP